MLHIIILILIILLALKYFLSKKNNSAESFSNYSPHYVFWTGGYDSTFRICELLVVHKVPVQPVYLDYNLDSANKTDFWVRKNRKQEYQAMNKVKQMLFQRFPYTKNLLNNTIIIVFVHVYKKWSCTVHS